MDNCVPSPNLLSTPFTTTSPCSIYDQDKTNVFCGVSDYSKLSNAADISAFAEEGGLLDDNYEDSSLKNILTPELLNSMASSSSSLISANPWESKYIPGESQNPSTDTPFIQFGLDSDLMISDLLNVDSNDSKFSFPFDFESMASNPPSSCHTPVPSESKTDNVDTSTERMSHLAGLKQPTSKDSVGQEFLSKKFPMKPNFPPRKAEPPIGIVAPVKMSEQNKISKRFHPGIKTRTLDSDEHDFKTRSVDMTELQPQIVPSFGVTEKTAFSSVKVEPSSPGFDSKALPLKRSLNDKWEDVKHFMTSDMSSASRNKRRRYDSGSSGLISEDGDEDDFNNDDDSDDDNSDLDADLAHMKPGGCESLIGVGKKQKQYFWQYNVQAKGPKGTRLKLAVETPTDPHVLNGFEDPVFDEGNTMVAGIRHGGKARKGDGNEVTPNPHKLFKIGHQLLRLNKKINACQLGSDVPLAKRNESRKEKNKLASRACRLKKKAQHEANKIKLHGLEAEHGQINNVLRLIWPELRERAKMLVNKRQVDEKPDAENSLTNKLTDYISTSLRSMVAGNTTDYVNNVIMTVERGDLSGGLKVKSRKT